MTGDTKLSLSPAAEQEGQGTLRVQKLFRWLVRLLLFLSLLTTCYWLFSSDRYVSEGIVIVQNTEQISAPSFDLTTMLGSIGKANSSDQLLLREHLLSVDMLRKLDAALDLRSHYSDSRWDFASRLWFIDDSIDTICPAFPWNMMTMPESCVSVPRPMMPGQPGPLPTCWSRKANAS